MPTTVVEGTVQSFTYDELLQWANLYGAGRGSNFNQWAAEAAKYGVGEEEALLDYLSRGESGLKVQQAADGTYRGWFFNSVEQMNNANSVNSNASTISRGSIRQMVGQKFENVQGVLTRNMTTFPASGGLGQQAAYVLGSVGYAVNAVSAGIWLGKTIDSALYNANPDYWNSIGLSSLNPELWNGMVNNDDSPFAGLFNFILGIDPNTGSSQMYMDENTLAYMAYALAQNGWFSDSINIPAVQTTGDYTITSMSDASTIFNYLFSICGWSINIESTVESAINNFLLVHSSERLVIVVNEYRGNNYTGWSPIQIYAVPQYINDTISLNTQINDIPNLELHGVGVASTQILTIDDSRIVTTNLPRNRNFVGYQLLSHQCILSNIGVTESSTIAGVSNQPNAVLPDVSNWTDIPSTLQSLQSQYPDAFNNPMVWDNYNDDGTANQTNWIPVPFPNITSSTDTQPTSGTQTQTSTNISQIPQELIDLLTEIIQQTQPQTETETEAPPQNPIDTGTGSSPTPVAPSGSSSALWSVYHPTQAQINSFGGWLWGSVFTTDIRKLFEDPIQGVIKLHKVFATPVDDDNGTIVVGTLDSNVPSATVTQQYVTVDCGYVDCHEDFGNVFDYPPFTEVSLYLPFIGIVPLDTNDVMRSTIHVTYGVDVFTGACLAMIEVSRDGSTVNMYQYAGVCSVDYPLSNVQASNMLSGLLTMGAGIASIVASGGISAPAAGAAIGGAATTLKRSVGRSGGFSGNAGAMGIKKPYLIIERPQTKVADTFPRLAGYPTNYSCKLGDCSNHVVVKHVHVEGIPATDTELAQIETLLKDGVLI